MECHKGEMCPFYKETGREPTLCQEGDCNSCQIWCDFIEGKTLNDLTKYFPKRLSFRARFMLGLKEAFMRQQAGISW